MAAQGAIFFFGKCFLIPLSGFEALKVAKIYVKNEVNPTFMAEERIWRQKRSRRSLWIMLIQNVKVVGNSRLVTIVAIIVSIALLITVVLVGKYLMMTRYISTKDLESDRTPFCFSLLECNN